jgi:hypothetical protein
MPGAGDFGDGFCAVLANQHRQSGGRNCLLVDAGWDKVKIGAECRAAVDLKPYDQLSQLNALVQLEHLMSYPIVRERVAAGTSRLSAWWFEVASGTMSAYDRASRSFEVIDRATAEQLVARLDRP